jgi:hypothetical protein
LRPEAVADFAADTSNDSIDCTAMKATWISRRSDKVNGSMIAWLLKSEAATYLLRKLIVISGPTSRFVAP